MTRDEFIALINETQELIPVEKHNRSGMKIAPAYITIHNTDNDSKGADAVAHSKFVRNTGFYTLPSGKKDWVSWHFTVDDKRAIQQLPIDEEAYHAKSGNSQSIAIEVCMNAGIDQPAAFLRAARLTALLLFDHSDTLDISRVVPHMKWTGKKCPVLLLDGGKLGAKWDAFIASVKAERDSITA